MAKLVFKTKPRPYQIPALRKLLKHGGGGLYVPMRWGKSWLAINASAGFYLQDGSRRVLIVCPNDVKDVWEEEISLHCPVDWTIIHDLTAPDFPPSTGLEFHIRNFESVYGRVYDDPDNPRAWSVTTDQVLLDWKPETVVVDEVHHIGNPTAVQSKKVVQVGKLARHRIFLTGTPFHRKPFYVFGQFKFYDESILGGNFGAYKRHVAVFGGYGGYEVLRYRNLRWLRNQIKPHVHIAKYVPPTPPTNRRITFSLTQSAAIYKEMEKESIVNVHGQDITAPIVLTRHLRLQQIAGGWLKDEGGRYHRVGSEKREAFARRVEEYRDQDITKFVVGARFIPELKDIWETVKAFGYRPVLIHGGVAREERTKRRKFFTENDNTVFVTQFRPSREGIDLSSASVMVFYSLPVDFLTYDQFKRRIEKYGEERSLLYEHLIAKGTRDEVSFKALSLGRDVAEYLMTDPRYVEQITKKPER